MAGQPACRIYPRATLGAVAGGVAAWVARKIVTNDARTAVQRFLFPKFFPKKFGQKIGAGPPMEDFGNGTCAGPVLLHPAPFRADEKHPGVFFRRHSGSVPSGARQTLLGAESRTSVCRRLAHISHIHPRAGQPSCHISATPRGVFLCAKTWGVQFPGAVWRPPPPISAFSLEDDRACAARERAITQ
jgi:hypothetical protein